MSKGSKHRRYVMLMVYFGRWPDWIEAYVETCRWNPDFDFLLMTDCGPLNFLLPRNVRQVPLTLEGLNGRFISAFPGCSPIAYPYKLCDLRPAFGVLFEEYIQGYEYFGWGDLDVIYGRIDDHLTEGKRSADVVSYHGDHVSGHLTLARTSCAEQLIDAFPNWRRDVNRADYCHLDEPEMLVDLNLSAIESYNTPLSPKKPWTNGQFVFPSEWYWEDGRLTNDLDGERTFPYLHFMHWKGGPWARECGNAQWERLEKTFHLAPGTASDGFRIDATGIHPLNGASSS